MRLLRDDLQDFIRRKGLKRGIEAAAVINAANYVIHKVLPATVRDQVRVESYYDGVLKLRTPTGGVLTTVHLYRQELLRQLKNRIGKAQVEKIQVLAEVPDDITG